MGVSYKGLPLEEGEVAAQNRIFYSNFNHGFNGGNEFLVD